MRSYSDLAFFLLIAAMLVSGCSQEQTILTPVGPGVIRIVSSLPSRGASALRSIEISEAIRTAVTDRSMPSGSRVEYIALDDSDEETGDWSPWRETANASAAANDPAVLAYIGPYNSGAAMLSIPITSKAGLPALSPSAAWPGLTLPGWDPQEPDKYYPTGSRTFFRLMPPDSVQAEAADRWASADGQRAVAVLEDGSSYSLGLARAFESAAARSGIRVTGKFHVAVDNVSTIAEELAQTQGAFYAPSSTGLAVRFARALNGSGLTIYSTDTALSDQFLTGAGDSAQRWRVISNSAPPSNYARYPPLTHVDRDFPSQFAANAYDLANIVLDAIASGNGQTREALLEYLRTTTRSTGGPGTRLFDDLGDPTSWTLSGYVVSGGVFRLARTFAGDSTGRMTVSVP